MEYYAVKYRDSYGLNGLFLFTTPDDAYNMYRSLDESNGDFYSYGAQEAVKHAISPSDAGIYSIDFSDARTWSEEFRGLALSSVIELGNDDIIKIFDDHGEQWVIHR